MPTIGSFSQDDLFGQEGTLETTTLKAKVKFVPLRERTGNQPDYRILEGNANWVPPGPAPRSAARTKSPKTKWRFTKVGEDWFCFAGLWRPMPDGGAAFTLLTTDPSADVAPIHDRQMVILERAVWSAWLEETGNEKEVLQALPAGSLAVEHIGP